MGGVWPGMMGRRHVDVEVGGWWWPYVLLGIGGWVDLVWCWYVGVDHGGLGMH